MEKEGLFAEIATMLSEVIERKTEHGRMLYAALSALHPADIADFLTEIGDLEARDLFLSFPQTQQLEIFKDFSDARKARFLQLLDEVHLRFILVHLSVDELTDFFDELSDEELERYLKLIHQKDRDQIVSVLQLDPDTAGRHMDVNVLALMSDFTVERSIQVLQRLQPSQELHHSIFVTNREGKLEGCILLEDLVLKKPDARLSSFLRKNEVVAQVDEDRESVAQKMVHYNVMIAPVVDKKGNFLGIIPSDELVDIIEEESSEDIYRMATMSPIKDSYFETPFWRLFCQRSSILIILLFAQTISTSIVAHYQAVLAAFLFTFTTMLVSTGGNTSSQTSALAIQGLATGEIDEKTFFRFIKREFMMACFLGVMLGGISFVRIYLWHMYFLGALAVSLSLTTIVIISVVFGSCIPLILKKLNIDPAHSAGPLLATLMDIIGIFIFCVVSSYIVS